MTNREINETINKYRGVQGYSGEINSLTAITHFFLMDASYDMYNKYIRTLPLKHEEKNISSAMLRCFNQYFHNFFAPFNQDQRDYILDKCDDMLEYIKNSVELARIAMMDCCEGDPVDAQIKEANIWLCNRFASEAQEFYKRTWKKAGFRMYGALYTKSDVDKNIDGILKYTIALSSRIFDNNSDVSDKHYDRFKKCVAAMTHSVCEWINEDFKREKK